MNKIYGIILTSLIAVVAMFVSKFLPMGSVVIAILIGAIISNTATIPNKFNDGITFSEKSLLSIAIALLGINLDFSLFSQLGIKTIFIVIFSLISTIMFTLYLSKKLNFDKNFALLIGIGNGVCGSAAIAATKDLLNVSKEKTAIAIAIVNLLGTIALFALPLVGVLLGFSDVKIGILLGNTLQSVGHVIAASFSVNESVGQSATIVKMGRVLLLTPIIFWLIYAVSKNLKAKKDDVKIEIPIFIIGFILFSIVSSLHILPQQIIDIISFIAETLLIIAMGAIGLKISFKAIKEHGSQALILASYIFKFQILLSILLIAFL